MSAQASCMQVVHLVRDPRGRYRSMEEAFGNRTEATCIQEMEDLAVRNLIPAQKC